jgi:hypothetical protein
MDSSNIICSYLEAREEYIVWSGNKSKVERIIHVVLILAFVVREAMKKKVKLMYQ